MITREQAEQAFSERYQHPQALLAPEIRHLQMKEINTNNVSLEDDTGPFEIEEQGWECTFKVMPERKEASRVNESMEAIETPINCRICGQETIENVNGVCKTCWEAGKHLKADSEPEKSPTKLDHQRGKMRVLSDDISYLIMRIEHGSLASLAEHYEVQEGIHELQHILADWDSYIGMEIAKKAAQHAVNNWVSQISMRVGRRQE